MIGGANRWYSISFSSEDMFSKALGIQSCVEGFHGTDYSEDTIYRESIDELVLIREKKQFNKKVSRLMNVVINAFSNQNDQEWYQQLRTPSQWQIASGIRNRRLDGNNTSNTIYRVTKDYHVCPCRERGRDLGPGGVFFYRVKKKGRIQE